MTSKLLKPVTRMTPAQTLLELKKRSNNMAKDYRTRVNRFMYGSSSSFPVEVFLRSFGTHSPQEGDLRGGRPPAPLQLRPAPCYNLLLFPSNRERLT